jgi:hypothetical protein
MRTGWLFLDIQHNVCSISAKVNRVWADGWPG